ncbi:MAG: SDR family NAD(P)-dependent oxidoreductase [Pseudomonadota bacterium]
MLYASALELDKAEPMANPDLEGQVALITGGARGIGRAAGVLLAARGARVHLADLLDCGDACDEISKAGGIAAGHHLDVRDRDACAELAREIAAGGEPVGILVCNAGVCPPGKPVWEDATDLEQWQRVIDINVNGTQNTVAAVWDGMRGQGRGRIVIISSMAFYQGGVIVGTEYSASKAALIGMTRHLARNGGPHGIVVNAVAPGVIETDMTRDFDKPELENIPLRRLGTSEDVAGPISFLCGPESAYMTGTVLNVTGGIVLAD